MTITCAMENADPAHNVPATVEVEYGYAEQVNQNFNERTHTQPFCGCYCRVFLCEAHALAAWNDDADSVRAMRRLPA
jgi:hypothetical protein